MNEMLLQFIWQYSLYNPAGLKTTDGEAITVIHPGRRNRDAGPDFTEARVKIGDTTLVGNVELHVHSSDWHRHGHETDQAYQNIILHVVYKHDLPAEQRNFPSLELTNSIPQYVINQYSSLVQTTQPIACARQLDNVNDLTKESWQSRLLAERWEQKLIEWKDQLQRSAGDWSSLFYWRIAANFGFKTNAAPFLMLAQSIPLITLGKHKDNLLHVEALLFGQAGMLEGDFKDEYPKRLQQEYRYQQKKYKLQPIPAHLWKFLRMRPANFPTIRIAQFAALTHQSLHLFSKVIESYTVKEMHALLDVTASEYWSTHFRFDDEPSKASPKALGNSSIDNIIINTIAPVQFLYAQCQGKHSDQERALQLLSSVKGEQNHIITAWNDAGWKPHNALHSQSLLQLFNSYCQPKRCLECSIGLGIIKSRPAE